MTNGLVAAWPPGATNAGWLGEPSGRMPGRIQGWPAGTQRAANRAERLLSQATAWWDVDAYRDGDRFLRNRGTGGELLNLRLGSSILANSNDPQYLATERRGYAYLPGVAGCTLSVPDESAWDAISNFDIRLRLALDDWTPSANNSVFSKWLTSDATINVLILNSGAIRCQLCTDGSTAINVDSTAATGIDDGSTKWIRVTRNATAGEVKFFTSNDNVTYTQLGNTVTGVTSSALFNSAATIKIGGFGATNASPATAKVYQVIAYSDLTETTKVLDIDCDAITSGSATSFTAVTGQTVTVNRATSGRKTVCVPARRLGGWPVMLLGTDDYLEVQDNWQHGLLNFRQGDSFTIVAVVRQWATPVSTGRYLSKYDSASGAGWSMQSTTTTHGITATLTDGTNTGSPASGASTAGALRTFTVVIDRTAKTATSYLNATAGTPVSLQSVGSLANVLPFRVGRQSGGSTTYQDFEFYGALVFRGRALTAAEIKTIADYMTARIA